MKDIEINGFRVHTMIKVPKLSGAIPTFSYQFLIYDNQGKIQNSPFSKIVAKSDLEFKSHLNGNLESFLNNGEIGICHIF